MGCFAKPLDAFSRLRELIPEFTGWSAFGLSVVDDGRNPAIRHRRYCVVHGNHASQATANAHQANQTIANANVRYGC